MGRWRIGMLTARQADFAPTSGALLNASTVGVARIAADVLSDDDIGAFADGTWLGNEAMHQRVTDALAKAGVGGEAVIRNALFLMEAYVIASLSVEHWLSGLTDS